MPRVCPNVLLAPPAAYVVVESLVVPWCFAVRRAAILRQRATEGDSRAAAWADIWALAIIEAQQEAIRCVG